MKKMNVYIYIYNIIFKCNGKMYSIIIMYAYLIGYYDCILVYWYIMLVQSNAKAIFLLYRKEERKKRIRFPRL